MGGQEKKIIIENKVRQTAPGTVHYKGQYSKNQTTINLIEYDEESYNETKDVEFSSIEKIYPSNNTIQWWEVIGLATDKKIQALGKLFQIPILLQEDIITPSQRPKLEIFGQGIFITMKMMYRKDNQIFPIHFSLVLKEGVLITFQEENTPIFKVLKQRIQEKLGNVRNLKADYLMFALLDAIVDYYHNIIDILHQKLEETEDELFDNNIEHEMLKLIQIMKKEIMLLNRWSRPVKDIANRLIQVDSDYVYKSTHIYLRDLEDHITQINEYIESNKEMVLGLMDFYMTSTNNKMNEIMKVLTIIGAIFIPLTFIAGVYGMNFDEMPELHLKYGYFYSLGLMAVLAGLLILYFKRKKWL